MGVYMCPYKASGRTVCPNRNDLIDGYGCAGKCLVPSHEMAIERLAIDVVNNWYGKNDARKERIFNEIQDRVNQIVAYCHPVSEDHGEKEKQ